MDGVLTGGRGALLLTISGIYGVMSYVVKQRTKGIGIRMALGASSIGLVRFVLGHSAKLAGAGMVPGTGLAMGVSKLFASLPSRKVYATELDAKALAHLEELAAKEKNVTPLKAAETDTNLPASFFDSIVMRLVYHHLTKPAEIDASLFRSLKPGGQLAVIDEEPNKGTSIPEGVPKNRGGHGVPQEILKGELIAAGFEVAIVCKDWPSRDAFHQIYCAVFRKPGP